MVEQHTVELAWLVVVGLSSVVSRECLKLAEGGSPRKTDSSEKCSATDQ